ncbi:carbohydrate ABC transporter permease [Microlunatus capsulatus]|uniref:Multiple sugar transport system permease protein n=1 Tax=Microlunatus capsulatus TaxID=99117 RepID=A0ABS4Z2K1_9ACTN|nr:sugar ABC transporter permease [Microlunatus capsulatus]MBP2415199.1 multiple sugar transport system permease protein [Microlunatus capsulatus]
MATTVAPTPTGAGAAADREPVTATRRGRPIRGQRAAFWLFVTPFLVGLVAFVYFPILWSAVLSFFDAQGTVLPTRFVGIDNYVTMLSDQAFTSSLLTFTVFAVLIVPTTFAASLALAVLVNRVTVAKAFFRSVFFLPTACSYVVASLVWKLSIFNGVRFGLANQILKAFGQEPVAWLSTIDPPWYWLVIVSVRLWLQCGFYMILFLAALQNINPELYEAAYVDGTKPGWKIFRHITLPLLKPTSISVLLLCLIAAYQGFDEFYNLVGNVEYARPPLVYLYYLALGTQQNFGLGSAGALILAAMIAVITVLQGKILGFGRPED